MKTIDRQRLDILRVAELKDVTFRVATDDVFERVSELGCRDYSCVTMFGAWTRRGPRTVRG